MRGKKRNRDGEEEEKRKGRVQKKYKRRKTEEK
jgi:hypothetical protein